MKSHPILFSGPMVRALLSGTKTQTRRGVKPKIAELLEWFGGKSDAADDRELDELLGQRTEEKGLRVWCADYPDEGSEVIRSPYGQPGDRLWVRETHAIVPRTAYAHSDGVQQTLRPDDPYEHDAAIYREGWCRSNGGFRWRPSIHMPRWASRITLEITAVRVEQLQDISEADAKSEGIERADDFFGCPCWKCYGDDADVVAPDDPTGSYRSLWESINGPGSWNANPWVWVVEFKVLKA